MMDAPILTSLQLEKIDSETNKKITSYYFSFGIYEDEECTKLIKKVEANKDKGNVTFENIRYGTYFIKEINAPVGYELSSKKVKIEICDKGVYVDGKLIEGKREIYSFEFYNLPVQEPNTGEKANYIAVIILAVLCGLYVIFIVKNFITKKEKE